MRADGLIVTGGNEFSDGIYQHGADRHLAQFSRDLRLLERQSHPALVVYSHSIVPGGLPEIS